jgi:hypothetical protein
MLRFLMPGFARVPALQSRSPHRLIFVDICPRASCLNHPPAPPPDQNIALHLQASRPVLDLHALQDSLTRDVEGGSFLGPSGHSREWRFFFSGPGSSAAIATIF